MNKNTALFYLFVVLAFFSSSCWFLSLFSFIACCLLLLLFFRRSACLSLCSLVFSCRYYHVLVITLFLVAVLAVFSLLLSPTFSHCCLCYLFTLLFSRCIFCSSLFSVLITSLLLFTLVVTLSTHYSHCLFSLRYFPLFSFDNCKVDWGAFNPFNMARQL